MALTALESVLLTIAIVGSVHVLVTLLQKMEDDHDCRDIMKDIAKYKFLQDPYFVIEKKQLPFYH